jgi:hypothetical protein
MDESMGFQPWEYRIYRLHRPVRQQKGGESWWAVLEEHSQVIEDELNQLGREGWEIVAWEHPDPEHVTALLKRPGGLGEGEAL